MPTPTWSRTRAATASTSSRPTSSSTSSARGDASLGAIFMGQVVEHLPAPTLVQTFQLAAAKLRPGGVLVAETINPLSPIALRNYFADLTHAQPLVPETLELLARQSGFAETEIRFLNEPAERLTEPDDPVIAANVRRLNDLLVRAARLRPRGANGRT